VTPCAHCPELRRLRKELQHQQRTLETIQVLTRIELKRVRRALEPRPHTKANQTAGETERAVGTVLGAAPSAAREGA
jgi:hypothetical protein